KPKGLQGASLTPLLENPMHAWNRPAFTQIRRKEGFMGRSVRTERWRYIEWDDGKRGEQLYDENRDPKEYVNLAEDPKHAAAVMQLKKVLRQAAESAPSAGARRE